MEKISPDLMLFGCPEHGRHVGPKCPVCGHDALAAIESILGQEPRTAGRAIDRLNAGLALVNAALKDVRAAGFSVEVYGGYGDVTYHMSGGPE